MNLSDLVVSSPFAGLVGWMVIHSLWQGAIASALLEAVLLLLRSPRWRYAAGCWAMVLMVLATAGTLMHLLPGNVDAPVALRAASSTAASVGVKLFLPRPGLER